jgi:hypothetical protein
MNNLFILKTIGSEGVNDKDVLVLMNTPRTDVNLLAPVLAKEILAILGGTGAPLCPFHWFETGHFLAERTTPLHLFLYGSVKEMRAVEHDSVFLSFASKLGVVVERLAIEEHERQVLVDIWRLRSCLVELLISPEAYKPGYASAARKAIQFVTRSYGSSCSTSDDANYADIVAAGQVLLEHVFGQL